VTIGRPTSSVGFYGAQLRQRGFSEVQIMRRREDLCCHFSRIRKELRKNYKNI